jgi:hypothetical protein
LLLLPSSLMMISVSSIAVNCATASVNTSVISVADLSWRPSSPASSSSSSSSSRCCNATQRQAGDAAVRCSQSRTLAGATVAPRRRLRSMFASGFSARPSGFCTSTTGTNASNTDRWQKRRRIMCLDSGKSMIGNVKSMLLRGLHRRCPETWIDNVN